MSQQLQEFLTLESSTEPRSEEWALCPSTPQALQGLPRRGCTALGSHLGQALLQVLVHSWLWGQRKPLQGPPAPWALLAHLLMPVLAAVDDLAAWQVMPTQLRFPIYA